MADPSFSYGMELSRIAQCNYVAAAALICYDYCLTFDREVRQMWKKARLSASLLFCIIRYTALLGSTIFVILDMTPWKGMSEEGCIFLVRVDMAMNILLLLGAAVFSSLRAYALCNGSRLILTVVFILGLVNPAITIYTFVSAVLVLFTVPAKLCGFSPTISSESYENWVVTARVSSVIVDMIVLTVTWMRTWKMRSEAAGIDSKATFTATLMRDGTMYFAILLVVNLVGLGLCRQMNFIYPMSTWIAIITAILTSRFILDLHEASERLAGVSDTQLTGFPTQSSVVFHTGGSGGQARRGGVYGTVLTETQLSSTCETSEPDETEQANDRAKNS